MVTGPLAGPKPGLMPGPMPGTGLGPKLGPIADPMADPIADPIAYPIAGPKDGPIAGPDAGPVADSAAGSSASEATASASNGSPFMARSRAAMFNLFIGDALAMPVHWYYNPGDIIRAFPPHGIRQMEAAPEQHPSSIMRLHSTRKGGRGTQGVTAGPEVVGDVILKDKRNFWGQSKGHYHQGLPAGENTLNAWWARRLMCFLTERGEPELRAWAEDYVAFMTADPPAHPDTYAESCHRGFFANVAAGRDLLACGAVTHDTPSMGALVIVAPLALALLPARPLAAVQRICREHVRLTHPEEGLLQVVDAYVSLMARLAHRPADAGDSESRSADGAADIIDALAEAAAVIPGTRLPALLAQRAGDAAVVGGKYSLACYISDSWPIVCYLAAKYHTDPERALIVNANLGGENAHRGAVLGTLVGLASGESPECLRAQLLHGPAIGGDIDAWSRRFAS